MCLNWDRIGTCDTVIEAEEGCDRRGVDRRDRNIRGG